MAMVTAPSPTGQASILKHQRALAAGDFMLTTGEVGRWLRVDPRRVRAWVRQGKVRAARTPGGRLVLSYNSIANHLDRTCEPAVSRG